MGGGFLRDIALRKQLEEKVKEAAKTRQRAEEAFEAATSVIERAGGIDADVREAQKALADASAAMSSKDYRAALERAEEAGERGRRAYAARAREFLESTRSLLSAAKELGLDQGDGPASLARAEEALGRDAYDEAVDLAKRAWKTSEKALHEHLSSSFSTAQALILTAKNIGKDTSGAEDLLSRARSAVESSDFDMALSFTRECLEGVTADLREEVDRHARDAEALAQTLRELDADPSPVSRLTDRARTDVANGDFDKALNSLRQAKIDGEKALGRSLEGRSAEFDTKVAEAERMGADVSKARSLFAEFTVALRDGDVPRATAHARDGMQALQKAQFDRVIGTISASRDKFVKARQIGADLNPALEHLNRARQALQGGRFAEAIAATKEADATVDQLVREFQNVEGEIRTLQRTFADAEATGVDTSSAKRVLERARTAFANRDLRGAVEALHRARDELDRGQTERAMEAIEKAEFLITMGERMAADLDEPSRVLEEAVTSAKGKRFGEALDLAGRARELTERAIQRVLSTSLGALQESLERLGPKASAVRTLIERAESAMSARDFESSYGFIEEAMRLTEGATKGRAEKFHDLLRTTVQLGISLGIDVSKIEAGLRDVNVAMDHGRYGDAVVVRDRLLRDVGLAADNVFNVVKGKVVEARNLQIDIAPMRELLKKAKIALGVEDYEEALAHLKECNDRATQTVGIHKEVYNAISSAAALVAEAKKRDVNVTKVLEMLLEAKRAHERFEHDRALQLANEAKAETEKLMTLYSSAQRIIAARGLLDTLAKTGVDAPHLRDMVEAAKKAMKEHDYGKALDLSERSEAQVRELLEERASSLLGAAEAAIGSLEGIDLLSQEQSIIRARELLDEGEVAKAVEVAATVREEIERIKMGSEQGSAAIGRAKDLATEVEAMNVTAPKAAKILMEADKAFAASRFDEAVSLAAKAVEAFEEARETQVSDMMARFEAAIEKAKKDKVNTKSAEKLILRAREFLKDRKYRQALALAMQAEGEAEKISLQQDMAAKAISTVDRKVGAFAVRIPDLDAMLGEAKRAFDEGDYVRALDAAIKTGEEFAHRRETYEEGLEVGKRAQRIRETATAMGLDTFELDALLSQAHEAVDGGEPERARGAFERALALGIQTVRSASEEAIAAGGEMVERVKALGVDAGVPLRKLSEARAHLGAEGFEEAHRFALEAIEVAKASAAGRVEEAIAAAEENLEHSRKLGADIARAEQTLASARESFAGGDFEGAIALADESRQAIQIRLDSEKRFAEKSFEAETTIRRAKKFGIDVLQAERVLAQAIQTKKSDHEKAMSLAAEAFALAEAAIEEFSPKLTASLEVSAPVAGEWAEGVLTVTNEAKALAKTVGIEILGDADVEGLKEVPALKAKGTETIPIKIRLNAPGAVPLAIHLRSHRILDEKEFKQEVVATVEVAEAPKKPPARLTATAESRCRVCKGLIKVGFSVGRCPHCSADMHELCASRSAKCPSCGKAIGEPAKRKKISFKVG